MQQLFYVAIEHVHQCTYEEKMQLVRGSILVSQLLGNYV